MLPTQTSVKIDAPNDEEFHGRSGFILYNSSSGVVEPCGDCATKELCEQSDCTDGKVLPRDWYVLVFDPLQTGGFAHCDEWFHEDDLVITGC